MRRRKYCAVLAVSALALAAAASSARAVEIVNQNFDTSPAPGYQYGYTYAGGGNPAADRGSLTSSSSTIGGVGRNGGNALQVNADFSQLNTVPPLPDYNYSGFGGGFGTFLYDFAQNKALGLPSTRLADYTGSIDLRAAGLTAADAGGEIQVQLQVPDDFFAADANTDMTPFAQIAIPVRIGPDYKTYTFSLDQGTLTFDNAVPAAERDFAKHAKDISLFAFNINVDNSGAFGNDAGNELDVDNALVQAVPEPASAGLFLAAAAGLTFLRRRR